ncbi:hypothetical protein AAGG52_08495 [Bacillus licheniformis]
MESLNRGLVAVKTGNGVFVSWRLLGTEPSSVSFNVYRNGKKLNGSPITSSTNYQDAGGDSNAVYQVRAVLNGMEQAPSETVGVWNKQYKSVPLQKPAGEKRLMGCHSHTAPMMRASATLMETANMKSFSSGILPIQRIIHRTDTREMC